MNFSLPSEILDRGEPPDFKQVFVTGALLDLHLKLGLPPLILNLPQLLYGWTALPTNIETWSE